VSVLKEDMTIHTHAHDRATALEYIRATYPKECVIADTPESAGPLLDYVDMGVIVIRDPRHDPPGQRRVGYLKGRNFHANLLETINEYAMKLHHSTESGRRAHEQFKAVIEEEKLLAAEAKRQRKAARRLAGR